MRLKELIKKEEEIYKKRLELYKRVEIKYKCIWRLKALKLASEFKETLHSLYSIEKEIEREADFLLENSQNPEEIINLYLERLNNVIAFLEREKQAWSIICENIKKELDSDIEEYKNEIELLKIKKTYERLLSKTC
ncbi:MAG: hypothetical protein B6D55_02390 [Candidatus Omnitrophica bacterium 4484_70.2]|nr:MAG: hypothetical protein B6D55_02390 [Candidatus Omnitrophica bacterium 4484_70.2]